MKSKYYNTTNEKDEALKQAKLKAGTQGDRVLSIFSDFRRLSASQCWLIYQRRYKSNTPLTSIRRAISNLADRGDLTKMPGKVIGIYGRNEYYYRRSQQDATGI